MTRSHALCDVCGPGWEQEAPARTPLAPARPTASRDTMHDCALFKLLQTDILVDEDGHGEFDLQYRHFDVRLHYLLGCQVELPAWMLRQVDRLAVSPGWKFGLCQVFVRLPGWTSPG